jgi:hypothetical protein
MYRYLSQRSNGSHHRFLISAQPVTKAALLLLWL